MELGARIVGVATASGLEGKSEFGRFKGGVGAETVADGFDGVRVKLLGNFVEEVVSG